MFVCCECYVLSGRGLCDELITRPEESYRLWWVVVCDQETSRMRRPWPALGCSATENKQNQLYRPETSRYGGSSGCQFTCLLYNPMAHYSFHKSPLDLILSHFNPVHISVNFWTSKTTHMFPEWPASLLPVSINSFFHTCLIHATCLAQLTVV